jgi:hypothetical protein
MQGMVETDEGIHLFLFPLQEGTHAYTLRAARITVLKARLPIYELLKLTSNSSLIFNDYENHIKGRSYTEDV